MESEKYIIRDTHNKNKNNYITIQEHLDSKFQGKSNSKYCDYFI